MDFAITEDGLTGQMTFDKATDFSNNIALSLMVKRGSFFALPDFGLREMPKKNTPPNLELVRQYCLEALQWIIEIGRAKTITVLAERDDDYRDRVNVKVTMQQANNQVVTFQTFVSVV